MFRKEVPGLDKAFEVDVHGQPAARVCYRNPNTLNFWLGLTEDYLRSYPVDGLMFGSERQGPLNTALGASHGGGAAAETVGCFCPHCLEAARKDGINAERREQGYLALQRWIEGMKGGTRPVDGAFVTFWRILVEHPEVLAWERLWNEGLRDTYRAMYRKAHEIAPDKPMGWHVWHTNSFAPFYRAEQDYAAFSDYSDFLKVVMYHDSGGPRMARYIRNVNATIFADLTLDQTTELTYRLQRSTAPRHRSTSCPPPGSRRTTCCVRPVARWRECAAPRKSGRASRLTSPPARTKNTQPQRMSTRR